MIVVHRLYTDSLRTRLCVQLFPSVFAFHLMSRASIVTLVMNGRVLRGVV